MKATNLLEHRLQVCFPLLTPTPSSTQLLKFSSLVNGKDQVYTVKLIFSLHLGDHLQASRWMALE